jgi:tetratricopeptide (TPR) repeat protein
MGILANLRHAYVLWRNDSWEANSKKAATKPRKKELFHISGWGPSRAASALVAAPYRGPLYPAPSYERYNPRKGHATSNAMATSWCNKAREAWSQNRLERAEQAYEDAIKICPGNPEFLFEESQLLWSQARLHEARKCLERALDIDPRFGSARASYLRVCVATGDRSHLASDFSKLNRDVYDLGILHAVGDEVRPALGVSNV